MNKDQSNGIFERLIYAVAMAVLMKLVAKGYIDEDMAAYVAGGVVAAAGSAWAWWINRPQALITSAANLPEVKNVTLDSTQAGTAALNAATPSNVKVG